ncbi:DUF2244 domain-containing protein [Fuscibacter oryzae]|uniref:DUF2244 domain-containing protein n=1 Tax=Fuscibacter oryzae TaxID=2803939 RepID=UPI001F1AE118|nr:DUF2244 domain-containing protein [Fuscibacter oryzae]
MPYRWLPSENTPERLTIWPYRSLPRRGFVWFIGGTAALLAVPLLAVLGSPILWALLPFLLGTVAAIWLALEKSYRDAEITEVLTLTRDQVTLIRLGPKGKRQDWQANPHWVQVGLYPTGGPVPDYLTLRGNGREVELGAFLTPEERKVLASELRQHLRATRSPGG